MTQLLTLEAIASLSALEAAATPGPWGEGWEYNDDAKFIAVARNALPALLEMARERVRLVSALEFLDGGDGNRGTHGADMRAPALIVMATRLGWKDPTKAEG